MVPRGSCGTCAPPDKEDVFPFTDLPCDMVREILGRLSLEDCLPIGEVSRDAMLHALTGLGRWEVRTAGGDGRLSHVARHAGHDLGLRELTLDLESTRIPFGRLGQLRSVRSDHVVTESGLERLSGLTGLRELLLSRCERVSDVGLSHVSGLTGLEHLELSSSWLCRITDAGLLHVAGLRGLRRLRLTCSMGVTDAGLCQLTALRGLETLEAIYSEGVTDVGFSAVCGMTCLRHLSLSGCQVTDVGLEGLCALSGLERLDVSFC